jgi:DNA-binding IclR family transcriptional regulator
MYLLSKESNSRVVSGRIVGWSLSHFREKYGIPKATFYRHLNEMIDSGAIVKQKRNSYVLSPNVRSMCNGVADWKAVR